MGRPSQLAVAILCTDHRPLVQRAIASAQSFGLAVHVGVGSRATFGMAPAGVELHEIEWRDSFADARNQLLACIASAYVLWLDSDEELFSMPALDWTALDHEAYSVLIQTSADLTPSIGLRIHRNREDTRWVGRVHERLCVGREAREPDWRLLPGAAVRHHGYDEAAERERKSERNAGLALRAMAEDPQGFYPTRLTLAREDTRQQRFSFFRWLDLYKAPYGGRPSIDHDSRWEPAWMLCSFGYTRPAKQLLAQNPLIVRLHLGVLAAERQAGLPLDEERLAFAQECVATGFLDLRYSFPRALLGAERAALLAAVGKIVTEWAAAAPRRIVAMPDPASDRLFRRVPNIDQDTFEDDLLIANLATGEVVALNHAATVLWDALRWPVSVDDLVAMLAEAQPGASVAAHREHVLSTLRTLREHGFIEPVER